MNAIEHNAFTEAARGQVSLDSRRSFKEHLELGQEIASLRQRGVLILGSGGASTGTIRTQLTTGRWSGRVKSAVDAHDAAALTSPAQWGEALLATAHPTLEHYLPLPYEGFDFGSISMRAVLFGDATLGTNNPQPTFLARLPVKF